MRAPLRIFLLVFFASFVLFHAASAAEIIFSSDTPVFYGQGDEASVKLDVDNTYGRDVTGSFTWTVRDAEDNREVSGFTEMRVIFSDQNSLEFYVQKSRGDAYYVDATFYYPDESSSGTAYQVKIEGIGVYFGDYGGFPGDLKENSIESVQAKISSDTTDRGSSSRSPSLTESNNPEQPGRNPENSESLSKFIEGETARITERKAEINEILEESNVTLGIVNFFEGLGYDAPETYITVGSGGLNDEYSIFLSGENKTRIEIAGEISGDGILYGYAESDGPVPLMYDIPENATYVSLNSSLMSDGFCIYKSGINVSGDDFEIRIFYARNSSEKEINITVRDGRIVSVVLEGDDPVTYYLLSVLVAVLTVILAYVFYRVYRRYSAGKEMRPAYEGREPLQPPEDPSVLLEMSLSDYEAGDVKEAFSKAGQALRLYISKRCCGGVNITNSRAKEIIRSADGGLPGASAEILSSCDSVVYGNREPSEGEFEEIYSGIKSVIEDDMDDDGEGD